MATARRAATPVPSRNKPTQIRELADGHDHHIKMAVYGEPGTGKTPLIATSPNCLILEADRGLESAIRTKSVAKKWTISDWKDLNEAYEYLANGGAKDWEWVWLDSITLFQDRGLDNIMDELVAQKDHRKVYAPDRGEFGQNMNRLLRFMRDFKDLPTNIGWTAHVMVHAHTQADGTVIERNMPFIHGKDMSPKICSHMGVIAHLQLHESKKNPGEDFPVLSVKSRDGWYGRDRYHAVGTIPNPTMQKVLDKIQGSPNKETN